MRSALLASAMVFAGVAVTAHAAKEALPPLDPALAAQGRSIYAHQCASCHGPQGEGAPHWQARNAQGELPAPPHGPQGHTWKHSDAMLYRIVREGWRDPFNKTKRLTMPAFRDVLSPRETRAVITFLKTLWKPEQRRFQWEESRKEPFPPQTNRTTRPADDRPPHEHGR